MLGLILHELLLAIALDLPLLLFSFFNNNAKK